MSNEGHSVAIIGKMWLHDTLCICVCVRGRGGDPICSTLSSCELLESSSDNDYVQFKILATVHDLAVTL